MGLRQVVARGITACSPRAWEAVFQALGPLLPDRAHQRTPGYKLHKLAEVLDADSPDDMYLRLISHWKDRPFPVVDTREPPSVVKDRSRWADLDDFTEQMMFLDTVAYLPDDLLVKLDRASMGVGLEARVPLLDHRVVEFAWRVPLSMKLRQGAGKWLLRQVLYKYVPESLVRRPKMGFAVPLDAWLRGPLREWADSLLEERRLREEGFFHPEPIRAKWAQHLSGRRDWQYDLWDVLMFQAWLDEHKPAAFRTSAPA
jgi:asparagine synthase (glutamine-hydrolysing)